MGIIGIIIQWVMQYWVAALVAAALVGAGITAVVVTSANDRDSGTEAVGGTEELTEGTAGPTAGSESPMQKSSGQTLPTNETPWGQGPSDQTTPASGNGTNLPDNQVPWGTGPSQ